MLWYVSYYHYYCGLKALIDDGDVDAGIRRRVF